MLLPRLTGTGNRFLIGLLATVIASTVIIFWPQRQFATVAGRPITADVIIMVVWVAMLLVAAALGHRVSTVMASPSRRFWRAWVVAFCLLAAAPAVMLGSVLIKPGSADLQNPPPLMFLCLGLGELILLTVMMFHPLGARSRRERACLWLDLATVLVAAAGFGGYLAAAAPIYDPVKLTWHVLSGPVAILLVAFALTKLLLSNLAPFTGRAGALVGLGAVLAAGATGLMPLLVAAGRANWYAMLVTLSYALVVAGARAQQRHCLTSTAVLEARPKRRSYSRLPYVAIAAVYGLLATTVGGPAPRTWMVLGACAGATALVIARQLAAFAENAFLLGQLKTSVDELRQAKAVLQAALGERDALTEQLRTLAFHDALTGLANRALFLDRADRAISRAVRGRGGIAVVLIDLDDFKPINDRHGHAAGDAVLVETAARLRRCVRGTDTVARLGGDEFAMVLEAFDAAELPDLHQVAERIIAALQEPITFGGSSLTVGASIGIAHDRHGEYDTDHLVRTADTAMYATKRHGKGGYHIIEPATATAEAVSTGS